MTPSHPREDEMNANVNACPICGERGFIERAYKIQGRIVRYRFAACLHSPEELAAAKK